MENVFDILRTFHIRKNVEEGMTQAEWIELLDTIEEAARLDAYATSSWSPDVPVTWIQDGGDE